MKPKKKRLLVRRQRLLRQQAESQNPSLKNENSVAQEKLKHSKKVKPAVVEEPAPVVEEPAPVVEKAPVKKTNPVVEETPVVVEEKPKPKIKRRSKRITKKTAE